MSRRLRVYREILLVATAVLTLRLSAPGDCVDCGGLWRLMVGRRATKDALCLKLDDALLRMCVTINDIQKPRLENVYY